MLSLLKSILVDRPKFFTVRQADFPFLPDDAAALCKLFGGRFPVLIFCAEFPMKLRNVR